MAIALGKKNKYNEEVENNNSDTGDFKNGHGSN